MRAKLLKTTSAISLALYATAQLAAQTSGQQPVAASPVKPTSPSTRMDVTPAGTPIINIAKPDDKGVSYNIYERLNVGREGAIFNNSPNIGDTMLGGTILANPNLVRDGRSANLILNEVVGGTRSDLNGPMEVFGPRASLVIANQSGITCDGCGFINVGRATLSTGKIVFGADGAFSGFAVNGGNVEIKGAGLLAGNVDYFDIIAASTLINANIYARDLTVAGGLSAYDYSTRTGSAVAGPAPKIVIDSSLLGGMYANRIRLIGTGAGVGVNLQGTLTALEGPLEITTDGTLAVKNIVGADNVTLKSASGNIRVDERLYAGRNAALEAATDIDQQGAFIGAGNNISLKAGHAVTLNGEALYAGLSSTGKLDKVGAISIKAGKSLDVAKAQAIANGTIALGSNNITIGSKALLAGDDVAVSANEALIGAGNIESRGNVSLNGKAVDLAGTTNAGGQLALTGDKITVAGHAVAVGGADVAAVDNLTVAADGSLQTNGNLALTANNISNDGKLVGVTGTKINVSGALDNAGTILSGGDLNVNVGGDATIGGAMTANHNLDLIVAGKADVSGGIAAVGDLNIAANAVSLGGTLSSTGALTLASQSNINMQAGSLAASDGETKFTALTDINANGYISSGRTIDLDARSAADIGGQAHAKTGLSVHAATIRVGGTVVSDADANLVSSGTLSVDGGLSAAENLQLAGQILTTGETSKLVATGDVVVGSASEIALKGAVSAKNVKFNAATSLTNDGSIYAAKDLSFSATGQISQNGQADAAGALSFNADSVSLAGKTIGVGGVTVNADAIQFAAANDLQSGAALALEVSKSLTLEGNILSVGDANIRSAGDIIQNAKIGFGANGQLTAGGQYLHQGTIQSGGNLEIVGGGVTGSGDALANGKIIVRSLSGLIDLSGNLSSLGGLAFDAADRVRLAGQVATEGLLTVDSAAVSLAGQVTAKDGLALNSESLELLAESELRSGTELSLSLAQLDNKGLLSAVGLLSLNITNDLTNSGQIVSGNDLQLAIGRDLANSGLIQADRDLLASIAGQGYLQGVISAGNANTIHGSSLTVGGIVTAENALVLNASNKLAIAQNATVFSRDKLALSATTLTNDGQISALGDSVLEAQNLQLEGKIESGKALSLVAQDVTVKGAVTALGDLSIASSGVIDITGGLSSANQLSLNGESVNLASTGTAVASGTLAIAASNVVNVQGQLASGDILSVNSNTLNNLGQIFSDQTIVLNASTAFTNAGLLQAGGLLAINADAVQLGGTNIGFNGVRVAADSLSLEGKLAANNSININSRLFEIAGNLASSGAISLKADSLDLRGGGGIESDDIVTLATTSLTANGRIAAGRGIDLTNSGDMNVGGSILSGSYLNLQNGGTLDIAGKMLSNNTMRLAVAGNAIVGGQIGAGGTLDVGSAGLTVDGNVSSNQNISFTGQSILLNDKATLVADGTIGMVSSDDIIIKGVASAGANTNLTSAKATILSGELSARGRATLHSDELILSGSLSTEGGVQVESATYGRIDGSILSAGDIIIDTAVLATGINSLVASNKNVLLTAGALDVAGNVGATTITLDATSLKNDGNLSAVNALDAAAGSVVNNGSLLAGSMLTLNAGTITAGITSDVQSGGTLSVTADEGIDVAGKLLAVGNAELTAGKNLLQSAQLLSGGNLSLRAGAILNQLGSIESNGLISLAADKVIGSGAINGSRSIALSGGLGGVDYSGALNSIEGLSLSAPGLIRLAGVASTNGIIGFSSENVTLDAVVTAIGGVTYMPNGNLTIGSAGGLRSGTDLTLDLGALTNVGLVSAAGAIQLDSKQFINRGAVVSDGALKLEVTGDFTHDGELQSGGALTAAIGGLAQINGEILAGTALDLSANMLSLNGSIGSVGTLDLSAAQDITTSIMASIGATGATQMLAGRAIYNKGIISSDARVSLASKSLVNEGYVQSGGNLNLSASTIQFGGEGVALGELSAGASEGLILDGRLSALGAINLSASTLNLGVNGEIVGDSGLMILSSDLLNAGKIGANGAVEIDTNSFSNIGSLIGSDLVTISAASRFNQDGLIQAGKALSLQSGALNLAGKVVALQSLDISGAGIVSQNGSELLSGGTMTLQASDLLALNGKIGVSDNLIIRAANNATIDGEIASGADVVIDGIKHLAIAGAIQSAGPVDLTGSTVSVTGNLLTNDALNIRAKDGLLDFGGEGVAEGNVTLIGGGVKLTGTLQSDAILSLRGADIEVSGKAIGIDGLTVSATNNLISASGSELLSNGLVAFDAANIAAKGRIAANGNVTLFASQNGNFGGTIVSADALRLTSGNLIVDGAIEAANYIGLTAQGKTTLAGTSQVISGGQLALTGSDAIVTAGTLASAGKMAINGSASLQLGGIIQSDQALTVRGADVAILGDVASNADFNIQSNNIVSVAGRLTSLGQGSVQANSIIVEANAAENKPGVVYTAQNLALTAVNDITNTGTIGSDASLLLNYGRALTNDGTLITGDDFTINTAADLNLGGDVISGGIVNLTARDITVDGTVVGKSGFTGAGRNIVIDGSAQSGTALSLTASDKILVNGSLLSLGTTTLEGANAISLASGGKVESVGILSVRSAGLVDAMTGSHIAGQGDIAFEGGIVSLAGALLTDGNLSLLSRNSLNVGGTISAAKNITLDGLNVDWRGTSIASGDVNLRSSTAKLGGSVSTGGNLAITANDALSFEATSDLAADKDIRISADTVTTNGKVVSNTLVQATAQTTFINNGEIGSGQIINLTSNGVFDNNGTISALGALTLIGNATSLNGTVETGDNLSINAGALSVLGALSGLKGVSLDATIVDAATTSRILSGNILDMAATGWAKLNGTLAAAGDINVLTGTALTIGGHIESDMAAKLSGQNVTFANGGAIFTTGSTSLNASSLLHVNGDISSNDVTTLLGAGVNVAGRVLSNQDILLNSSATLTNSGTIGTKNSIHFTRAGAFNNSGSIEAGGDIILGAGGANVIGGSVAAGGAIDIDGTTANLSGKIRSVGAFALDGTAVTLAPTTDIVSGGTLSIAAIGNITTGGNIGSIGDAIINAGGNLTQAANLSSLGKLDLTAGSSLSVTQRTESAATMLLSGASVSTGLLTDKQTLAAAGNLNVISRAGDITLGGASSSAGNLTLQSARNVFINQQTETAGALDVSAHDIAVNAGLIGQTAAKFNAVGAVTIASNGVVASAGDISLLAASLANDGTLYAGNNAKLTLAGAYAGAGDIATVNTLTLGASTISVATNGSVEAGNGMALTSTGSTLIDGQIYSAKILDITSGNLTLGGALIAGQAINLHSGSDGLLKNGSQIISDGAVVVSTVGKTDIAGSINSAQGLTVTSGGALTTASTADVQSQGAIVLGGRGVTLGGKIIGDTTLSVNATNGSGLSIGGKLASLQNMSFTGGVTTLANGSDLGSNGIIQFTGQSIDSAATISSAGGITLNAIGNITARNSLLSGGAINVSAGGTVNQIGVIQSDSSLSVGGANIVLGNDAIAKLGVTLSGGNISLAAGKSWQSAANLTMNGGNFVNDGTLYSTGNLVADMTGAINQKGIISSASNVSLTADGNFTNTGTIEVASTVGALGIEGANLQLGGQIISNGNVGIIQTSGDGTLSGVLSAQNNLTLNAAGKTLLTGTVTSGKDLTISSAELLDVATAGQIYADGAATISGAQIRNNGRVSVLGALGMNAPILTNNGTVESGEILSLVVNGGTLGGTIGSNANVAVTATTDALVLQGDVKGSNVTINAVNGGLTLGSNAQLLAAQSASLLSGANLIIDGAILTGKNTNGLGLSLKATTGAIGLGATAQVSTLGNAQILARDSFTNNGSGMNAAGDLLGIEAAGNIEVTAGTITTGQLLSNGTLSLTADNLLQVTGEVNAGQKVSATSSRGQINLLSSGALRSQSGAVNLNAAQLIDNKGVIAAKTGVTLDSAQQVDNSGTIYTAGGLLTAKAPNLNLAGTVYAAGNPGLLLDATNVSITGTVGSDARLTLDNPLMALTVSEGGLLQSNNALTLDIGSANIAGTVRSLGSLSGSIGSLTTAETGEMEAAAAFDVTASGAFNHAGTIVAGGNIELSANQMDIGGVISTAHYATLNSSTGLSIGGLIETGIGVALQGSAVNISASGTVRSAGAIMGTAGRFINAGTIASGNAISIAGTTALTSIGKIHANSGLTFSSSGTANVSGDISSMGTITINANSIVTGGDIVANGAVTATTGSGAILVDGNIVAGAGGTGAVALRAAIDGITVNAGKEIFGQEGVALTAASITNQGNLTSPGDVTLNGINNINHSGNIIAGGKASLLTPTSGGGQINVSGRVDGSAIVVTTPALNIANNGLLRSTGVINLTVPNSATIDGRVIADGAVTFNGAVGGDTALTIGQAGQFSSLGSTVLIDKVKTLTVNGLISAKDSVTANYSGTATIGSTGRIEAISYDASGNATGGDIILSYTGAAGNSGNNLIVDGNIAASRDITVKNGAGIINGQIYAGRNLTVTSNNFSTNASNISNTIVVTSQGTLASAGNTIVNVTGGLTVDNGGLIYGDNDVTLTALNHVINGEVYAGGALNFANRRDVFGYSTATTDPVAGFIINGSAQAGGAITVNAGATDVVIGSNGQLLSNDKVTLRGGNINNAGDIAAGDLISMNANQAIVLGGLVQSGRRIEAVAGTTISVLSGAQIETYGTTQAISTAPDQGSLANISLQAQGNISNVGTIFSDGSVVIKSVNSDVINQSKITALGGAVVQANNAAVKNLGVITGSSLGIYQGQDFNNTGSYIANGNLLISAPNISNADGALIGAGGALTLNSSGSIYNAGTLFAGTNLSVDAGISFQNDQGLVLSALGNIAITAPTVLNESGRIESLSGDVTIDSANVVNRIKNLVTTGTGSNPAGYYNAGNQGPFSITEKECDTPYAQCYGDSYGREIIFVPAYYVSPNTGDPIEAGTYSYYDPGDKAGVYTETGTYLGPLTEADCLAPGITCSEAMQGGYFEPLEGNAVHVQNGYTSTSGVYWAPGTYYFTYGGISGEETVVTNSGASEIIAAGDVVINGGATGNVTNKNSSILAGRDIHITTGTLNNLTQASLPTIIRANGNLYITANQINNGTVGAGPVSGSGDTSPNTNLIGASQVGGRDGFANPYQLTATNTASGVVGRVAGSRTGATSGAIRRDHGYSNQALSENEGVGGGAGSITGVGTNVSPTAGSATTVANRNVSSTNTRTGPTRYADGAINETVGATNTNISAVIRQAVVKGSGYGDGVSNNQVDQAGAVADHNVNFVNNGAASVSDLTRGNGVDSLGATNYNVTAVSLQNADGQIAAGGGTLSGGNVGAATDALGVVRNPGAVEIGDVKRVEGKPGTPVSGAVGTTKINPLDLVDGYNGTAVDTIGAVNPIGDGANAASEIAAHNTPAAATLDPTEGVDGANVSNNASIDSSLAADASSTILVDGFNGLAIADIIGPEGKAGSFISDFLRQYDLVNSNGGFGFANGNGLFTFSDSPDAKYLFTTNRGFDGISGLFDSDYFFDQLSVDKGTHFTRLGDGFFEAQLISKQVRAATGQTQLPQFGSALDQAQALMQSAVTQQKGMNLQLGVALSTEQVASLTNTLVWWVNADLAGRNVLVPVVYLAAADQKSIQNGAIIAGTNVVAKVTGDIRNTGTIEASRVVSLTAGGDILNAQGGRINGGTVVASAARDIINSGTSSITGGDIMLNAGRDIAVVADTQVLSAGNTKINGGQIAASGNLLMNAGRDVSIISSSVGAGGDAAIVAARDINVSGTTQNATSTESWRTNKKNYGTASTTSTDFVGSTVAAGGNLVLDAGNMVTIKGSDVAAQGDLGISAVNGVNILAGQSTSETNLSQRAGKTRTTSNETSLTNELSTVAAGGNVVISTPGKVTIAGGNVVAGNTAAINAGNVEVTGVVDVATLDSTSIKKKSGMLSSKKTTTTTHIIDQTAVASSVEGDNVAINSAGDVAIRGSNVIATNDIAIKAAGTVDIGALQTTDVTDQTVKVKKSGLSLSGGSLFVGTSKNSNVSENNALTNNGSLVGSSNGNVSIVADGKVGVTASQIVAPGAVTIAGQSVDILSATDVTTGKVTNKASSFGITASVNVPILNTVQAIADTAKVAANGDSDRTRAVAALASGVAASNAMDQVGGVAQAIKNQNPLDAGSIKVSVGFSKSSSVTNTVDQTVVGSEVQGGDVALIASGAGDRSTINVVGSNVTAGRDLSVAAQGAINLVAAQETDTMSSRNRSSGASVGVSIGAGGITPTGSFNLGKGNAASTDVRNIESTLSAGGTATIVTPGALTLKGAEVAANLVKVEAGSLTAESLQDTSTYRSNQTNVGVEVSLNPSSNSGGASGALNYGSTRQSGNFTSVAEQTGIKAGNGGFDINVADATTLKGAVIDSTADPANNRLITGTLLTSDLQNSERYRASSINLGVSISGVGADKPGGATGSQQGGVGSDGKGNAVSNGADNRTSGLSTSLGTISATAPVAMGASGSQSGTTRSAIADGTITITSGDTASQQVAQTISRDTTNANAGSLTQEFTDAKRAEIERGFAVTRELANQTSTFFANRAAEEADKRKEAQAYEAAAIAAGVVRNEDGTLRRDEKGNLIALNGNAEAQAAIQSARTNTEAAYQLNATFGAGSAARLIATAINGAAGSNVSGGLTQLVQASAVNVLQSLAATEVKRIADGLGRRDDQGRLLRNPDGSIVQTTESELLRGTLQGLTACGGAGVGGSGGCDSAVMGAAASVAVNLLLNSIDQSRDANRDKDMEFDANGNPVASMELENQEARSNLVATIIGSIATASGLDVNAAVTAAQIETQNNDLGPYKPCPAGSTNCIDKKTFLAQEDVQDWIEILGISEERAWQCATTSSEQCVTLNAKYAKTKIDELKQYADLTSEQEAALLKMSPSQLNQQIVDVKDKHNIAQIRQSDPVFADKLEGQSIEVRRLVYQDLQRGEGDNLVGQTVGAILELAVDDRSTLIDAYLALKSDEVGEWKGPVDSRLASARDNVTRMADGARAVVQKRAAEMRANGQFGLADAYELQANREIAREEARALNGIDTVKTIGDAIVNPARALSNAVTGTLDTFARGIDTALNETRRPDEIVADLVTGAKDKVDAFAALSPAEQGRKIGAFEGNVEAEAAKAVVGGVVGRYLGGRRVDAPDGLTPYETPDFVVRRDGDFSSSVNHKGNPKAYIDENGNLISANPDGTGNIATHVRGTNPGQTPFISTADPNFAGPDAKFFGTSEVSIDTRSLEQAILRGDPDVQNIRIVSHGSVVRTLQNEVDAALVRYNQNPSRANRDSLTRAQEVLGYAKRDGEVLIQVTGSGSIPSRFLSGQRPAVPNDMLRKPPPQRAPTMPAVTGAGAGVLVPGASVPLISPPPSQPKDDNND